MSTTPYMPFWIADFVADTMDLDAKEVGAYMLILMAMWNRKGELPNDEKKLQRIARVGRDWPKIWNAISGFFTVEDDTIRNRRLTDEYNQVCAKREVNAQSGARGGKAKALKNNKAGLANAGHSLKQPYPYPDKNNISRFDEFWIVFNDRRGRANALKVWKRKNLDDCADDVIAGAELYAKFRGSEQKYWKMAEGWLNGERWRDDAKAVDDARLAAWHHHTFDDAFWRGQLKRYFALPVHQQENPSQVAWPNGLGPPPGQPGCRAPKHLLDEHKQEAA